MRQKNAIAVFLILSLFNFNCKKKDNPIIYTQVAITKLTVSAYPPTSNTGTNWDDILGGSYPDVYFKITKQGTSDLLFNVSSANRVENLQQSSLPVSWNANGSVPFYTHTDLTQPIDVDLYDYDSLSSDDYMGSAPFSFSDYTSGSDKYPSSITKSYGGVTVKLELIWKQ